jgi:hypothetical protein
VAHRLRAHEAFRALGLDLMEYVLTSPARQTSEDDRVVAVTDDAILRVPQHRAGENLTLDVGAAPGELGDDSAWVTRTVSCSMMGPRRGRP